MPNTLLDKRVKSTIDLLGRLPKGFMSKTIILLTFSQYCAVHAPSAIEASFGQVKVQSFDSLREQAATSFFREIKTNMISQIWQRLALRCTNIFRIWLKPLVVECCTIGVSTVPGP